MLKKILGVAIGCILAVVVLAACDAPGGGGAAPAGEGAATMVGDIDVSNHVNLVMYLLGDEPTDLDIVYEQLNELLLERINATLTTNYLSWGTWTEMYSLILAAGEGVDLIFTADWAFYAQEANRGAFFEFTPEFMERYMPNTVRFQSPNSLMQATLDGRIYAIPKNVSGLEGENWAVIRRDLRESYGMDEITTAEELEAFFMAVLENETGIFPHHASGDGGFLNIIHNQPNQLFFIPSVDIVFEYPGTSIPPASAFEYQWFRDSMLPYFQTMQRWGEMGFWSANAINNPIQVRDSFENGTSASLTWNFTIFRAGENLRANNPDWDFEVVDINPGTTRRGSQYTNDAIAISIASSNPERAAMFIDLLKDEDDLEVYLALVGGIYGMHYNLIEDGLFFEPGPYADRYPWNPSTWCFNHRPGVAPSARMLPEELIFQDEQLVWLRNPRPTGFRFNQEPVTHEIVALNALRDEVRPLLQLGMAADVVATWDDWRSRAEAIGLERVMEEFRSQYDAWAATLD